MIDITRARPHQKVFFIVDDFNNIIGYSTEEWRAKDHLEELIYSGFIIEGKIIYDERDIANNE